MTLFTGVFRGEGVAPHLMNEASHLCGYNEQNGLVKLSEGQWSDIQLKRYSVHILHLCHITYTHCVL